MSQHHPKQSVSLYAWPPSPGLLSLQLMARSILLLVDVIGLSILFAIGPSLGQASAIVGGSFLVVSFILTPFFMFWNGRLLRRVKRMREKYQQDQDTDRAASRFRTKCLKFVIFLDGLGTLAFFVTFFPIINDVTRESWWDRPSGAQRVTFTYGSVCILCATILHCFLFVTEIVQLDSALHVRKDKKLVCPHCSHTMTRVTTSNEFSTPPESILAGHVDSMLVDSLVDARISMSPGQETGTTFKTPRQSEHQSRAITAAPQEGQANEAGEGERDTLISKNG